MITAEPITRRRDVICVIDHLSRSMDVADAAVSGRFVHGGIELHLGHRVDWLGDGLADDEEWRIEWVKFYEGLDLAHAFSVTGDRRYLDSWCRLIAQFCEQVPVGHDSSDVSARRMQNWLYGWQRFELAGAPFDQRFIDTLVERLVADASHLANHLTAGRNHRTLELYALLLVGLALPEAMGQVDRLDNASLAEFALDQLAVNAASDLFADGTQRECSTDYHHIVLRSLLGALANARHFELPVATEFVERIGRACDFALHVQRPDGTIPSFSDGDNGDFRDVLALGASLLDRPDLAWASSGGGVGLPPKQRCVTFADSGYVVQRSGWGEGTRPYDEELFALFDCGPLGDGGHGHYDQLHVELIAGRDVLAVDPGRYTYADGPWRRWFKGTAAHNTVTVDGADQTRYRRGKPKGPVSQARIIERQTDARFDVVVGEVISPEYNAVHTRRLVFVDNRYWVIHDLLRAPTAHRYRQHWHLAADASPVISERSSRVTTIDTHNARYVLAGASDVRIEEGWISESYGTKVPGLTIVASVVGANADVLTAVIPCGSGPRPEVMWASTQAGACELALSGFDGEPKTFEVFRWPTERTPVGSVETARATTVSWQRHEPTGETSVCLTMAGDNERAAGLACPASARSER